MALRLDLVAHACMPSDHLGFDPRGHLSGGVGVEAHLAGCAQRPAQNARLQHGDLQRNGRSLLGREVYLVVLCVPVVARCIAGIGLLSVGRGQRRLRLRPIDVTAVGMARLLPREDVVWCPGRPQDAGIVGDRDRVAKRREDNEERKPEDRNAYPADAD